jgi:hypothetical protein
MPWRGQFQPDPEMLHSAPGRVVSCAKKSGGILKKIARTGDDVPIISCSEIVLTRDTLMNDDIDDLDCESDAPCVTPLESIAWACMAVAFFVSVFWLAIYLGGDGK